MKTCLSVDWDFFYPQGGEDEFDHAHMEGNPFLQGVIWLHRASNILGRGEKLPDTSGEEVGFWDRFTFSPDVEVFVSDSHVNMVHEQVRDDVIRVVNFDAHHDCGYGEEQFKTALDWSFGCSNWGLFFSQIGCFPTEVVYPAWKKDNNLDIPRGRAEDSCFTRYDDGASYTLPIDRVFIARSGSWVPPWLDEKFKSFVESAPAPAVVLDGLSLIRHFSEEQALEHYEAVQSDLKELEDV